MNTRSILAGSYDLKQQYQKNMMLGFGISAGVHLLAIIIVLIAMSVGSQEIINAPELIIRSKADLIVPPSLSQQQEQIRVAVPERQVRPSVGVPTPVPDEEAPEEVEVATQQDLAEMAPQAPVEDLSDVNVNVDVDKVMEELLPSPDQFIPVEEMPNKIKDVTPVYPELARRASIEGDVWVKALVDREGNVRDVIIAKASGANAGFEEAAIDAGKQCVWRPAIANGQPVAVWVTYKVEFKLKNK